PGRLSPAHYHHAINLLRAEVGLATPVRNVTVDDKLADRSVTFIDRYSLNSTDAILLRSALDLAPSLRVSGNDLMIVASDQRLLKAAKAEGLITFNPETETPAALDALLGP